MTLTDRDRKIVTAVVPFVVLMAYWFLLLAPKREEASVAAETLATEQANLDEVEGRASVVAAAKENFARDYATVVRLGKAIPTSVDMPSLLVQLEHSAKGTGIEFQSITAGPRQAATTAPPTGDPGTATAEGAEPADAAATDDTAATDAAAAPAEVPAPADGGTAVAAESSPSGALESVPLEFAFEGSFFELADFFHELKRFVYVDGDQVRVRGRLMSIDSVSYATDPETFPALTASVKATVFLTPKAEGTTVGATPSGPAPAAPADAATASAPAPAAPTAASTP